MRTRPTTPTPFLALLAMAVVWAASCSDDEGEAADTGTDVSDVSDVSDTTDVAETAPDVEAEPDLPQGTGSIGGTIFNNTGTTSGTLIVGLSTTLPVVGSPVRTTVFGSPSAPSQTYQLNDVQLGTYYVVALWDVGPTDTFESPGEGDLFGATEDPVGLVSDGMVLQNINVEVE